MLSLASGQRTGPRERLIVYAVESIFDGGRRQGVGTKVSDGHNAFYIGVTLSGVGSIYGHNGSIVCGDNIQRCVPQTASVCSCYDGVAAVVDFQFRNHSIWQPVGVGLPCSKGILAVVHTGIGAYVKTVVGVLLVNDGVARYGRKPVGVIGPGIA